MIIRFLAFFVLWRVFRPGLLLYVVLAGSLFLTGCDIAGRMYNQVKKDVRIHMFPEDIVDESAPLASDTFICDHARTLIIYKNEGTGTAVVRYEGKSAFLERITGIEDEIYRDSRTTLRMFDEENAELAREQVPVLTNCERQLIRSNKEFVN